MDWLTSFPGSKQVLSLAKKTFASIYQTGPVPRHVAFVMDGNRRYAKNKKMEVKEGHNAGFESMAQILELCYECGVESATVFAFSIENFKRSQYEIDWLMELAKAKFTQICENGELCSKYGVRIRILGEVELLPKDVQLVLRQAENLTKNNTRALLNVCLPYTSRQEMTQAIKRTVQEAEDGLVAIRDINQEVLESNFYTHGLPQLDLFIRTSGTHRLSDFLLWQCHGSNCQIEMVETLWPNFGAIEMAWILLKWSFNNTYKKDVNEDLKTK